MTAPAPTMVVCVNPDCPELGVPKELPATVPLEGTTCGGFVLNEPPEPPFFCGTQVQAAP